jgi:hypothetical protein
MAFSFSRIFGTQGTPGPVVAPSDANKPAVVYEDPDEYVVSEGILQSACIETPRRVGHDTRGLFSVTLSVGAGTAGDVYRRAVTTLQQYDARAKPRDYRMPPRNHAAGWSLPSGEWRCTASSPDEPACLDMYGRPAAATLFTVDPHLMFCGVRLNVKIGVQMYVYRFGVGDARRGVAMRLVWVQDLACVTLVDRTGPVADAHRAWDAFAASPLPCESISA